MLKLKVINSQIGEVHTKTLTPETGILGECLIGRHSRCGLVLNSAEVSRVHARIFFYRGEYCFSDLGSTDGSRINNKEVEINEKCILKPDDVIRIGGFVLLIEEVALNGDRPPTSQNGFAGVAPTQNIRQWTQGEITVRCIQTINETRDVKTFRFVADPQVLFAYQPGQFVTLHLEIDGKQVRRSYSISSTPSRPHTLEITVKRVPEGLVSNWLHDNIKVGSQVKLSGPMGKFTCFANPSEKLLLISAGSGITPVMSMSRWLCDTGCDRDVVFIHSARTPRDIIFRQELELMAVRHPNFKLAVTTTQSEPGHAWLGYTSRLNESTLQAIAPDFRSRTVYVCGPNPFMEGVKAMLKGLDFPMHNYYEESFGGKKQTIPAPEPVTNADLTAPLTHSTPQRPPTSTSSQTTVVFAKSGKEVACDGEESILEVAEQEKIELPYACRMGACGSCKQKRLEGNVKYDQDPVFKCEEGYVLTCIAKPVGRVAIDA